MNNILRSVSLTAVLALSVTFGLAPSAVSAPPGASPIPSFTHDRFYNNVVDSGTPSTLFNPVAAALYPAALLPEGSDSFILVLEALVLPRLTTNRVALVRGSGAGGEALIPLGTTGTPRDIAVAADGSIYISFTNPNQIRKYDANGEFMYTWGQQAQFGAMIDAPMRIAVGSNGNVYALDTSAGLISEYVIKSDGALQSALPFRYFGGRSTATPVGSGQFLSASGLAAGEDGSIYVSDESHNSISKFSADGSFITRWSSEPQSIPGGRDIEGPQRLTVDSSGNVFVVERDRKSVAMLAASGKHLTTMALPDNLANDNTASSVIVDATGAVHVAALTSAYNLGYPMAIMHAFEPDLNAALPTISGTLRVGSELTASIGPWSATPSGVSFTWRRDGAAIPLAAGTKYTITSNDIGRRISVTVNATRERSPAVELSSAQTVAVPKIVPHVTLTASSAKQTYKTKARTTMFVSVSAQGAAGTPTGTVQLRDGNKLIASASLRNGVASFTLPNNLPVGTRGLSAMFTPTSSTAVLVASGSSAVTKMTVVKAPSKVAIKLGEKKFTRSAKAKVTVSVTAAGVPKASGKIKITYGKKSKTVTLKAKHKGKITVTLPKLKKGKYAVTATYNGSATVAKKKSKKVTLTVR